ncbi:MAG: Hint domain-containing protein [Planktomarina sp.]
MQLHNQFQTLLAFDGNDLSVVEGANFGDPLSFAQDLILDDTYKLTKFARTKRLSIAAHAGHYQLSVDTELGAPGSDLYLDSVVTLMALDGRTLEALIFVEVEDGAAEGIFIHPLSPMRPEQTYRLVGVDTDNAKLKLAEIASVNFTRGTRITMANGAQRPIEMIKPGDRVLTRRKGPQTVRWVGQSTLRAEGQFAPVLIREGALNNENDLLVSPDHRLFVYQRCDTLGTGRSEMLIKARYLVNGTDICVQEGGFIDYFQILFDEHHIIYAEGIAAESLVMDQRTENALPLEMSQKMVRHTDMRKHIFELPETYVRPDLMQRVRVANA